MSEATSISLKPEVTVKPSSIEITNFESLQKQVTMYAAKYENYVATEATLKNDKGLRAELKKTTSLLDEKRKEVKRGYNKPLNDFETQIKGLERIIQTVIDPIDAGIKDLENKEREARRADVQTIIDEMAPKYEVDANDVEIDSTWLNKSISNKKLLDGIGGAMHDIKAAKDKLAGDIKAITEYCAAMGIDAGGYIDQIKSGALLSDVMQRANNYQQQLKEQAETERKQEEARQAVTRLEQIKHGDKTVNADTGEIIIEFPEFYSVVFEVIGTDEQLDSLARFCVQNDLKVNTKQPRERVGA
ncbi:DUF1351 domain-containing protein [Furfurilactobacillus sp. WILCCON 0119]